MNKYSLVRTCFMLVKTTTYDWRVYATMIFKKTAYDFSVGLMTNHNIFPDILIIMYAKFIIVGYMCQ